MGSSRSRAVVVVDGDATTHMPEVWSPSRMSTYKTCPAKFAFQTIAEYPTKTTAEQLRGILAHAAAEVIFDRPAAERTVDAIVAQVRPAWETLDRQDDFSHLADQIDAIIAEAEGQCRSWPRVEDPQRLEPVAREKWVYGQIGGVNVRGIIDRLDQPTIGGKPQLVVSDYKTSIRVPRDSDRFVEERFFGMKVYAACLDGQGERPYAIRLVFMAGDSPEAALVRVVDDRMLTEVAATVRDIVAAAERDADARQFSTAPGPLCNWCDYEDICPSTLGETQVTITPAPRPEG